MPEFETASRVEGQGKNPQDRVAIIQRGSVVVGVVADGAGGTSGGAAAATLVVEYVRQAINDANDLLDPAEWKRLLLAVGNKLENESIGQTTAVIAATNGAVVVGASVGDSGAWIVGARDVRDLSAGQPRKPLLGGGEVEPCTFRQETRPGETLLLATDGILKYASSERICIALRRADESPDEHCASLVRIVRLPSGRLQDDVGLVVIRSGAGDVTASEVASFVVLAQRFCEFVEGAADLPMNQRLAMARNHLLDLYIAGTRLPFVEPPEAVNAGPSPESPKEWPGFEKLDMYWEIFDPYEEGEPVVGSLSDDVLDVYRDLRRGLALWNSPAPNTAAIWEWRFHFDAHWGDHAIDALRALHRACGRK